MKLVVYYRGVVINDHASIADLRYYYVHLSELDVDFDRILECLIVEHEYHLETWNGKRLFDVFVVSG